MISYQSTDQSSTRLPRVSRDLLSCTFPSIRHHITTASASIPLTHHQSSSKMMLSASPFHRQNPFTSSRPSPLAERSANVLPRAFNFTMASQPQFEKKPVPQRAHKPNPIVQSRDAATQRRRDMFFRRVQKDRDDKKWEARGEQVRLNSICTHRHIF